VPVLVQGWIQTINNSSCSKRKLCYWQWGNPENLIATTILLLLLLHPSHQHARHSGRVPQLKSQRVVSQWPSLQKALLFHHLLTTESILPTHPLFVRVKQAGYRPINLSWHCTSKNSSQQILKKLMASTQSF
jgi:hypothetical protein